MGTRHEVHENTITTRSIVWYNHVLTTDVRAGLTFKDIISQSQSRPLEHKRSAYASCCFETLESKSIQ